MPITQQQYNNVLNQCSKIWDSIFLYNSGDIEYSPDGTIYAERIIGGVTTTYQITEKCCNILKDRLVSNPPLDYPANSDPNDIYFDLDEQKCRWAQPSIDSCLTSDTSIKVVLNPVGNDGAFFTLGENDICRLEVSFKYLFKISCESLKNTISTINNPLLKPSYEELTSLRKINFEKEAELLNINNQIQNLSIQAANTPYSIVCDEFPDNEEEVKSEPKTEITQNQKLPFLNTGFGSMTNTLETISQTKVSPTYNTKIVNFCLTETGLSAWKKILGNINYTEFINGNPNSYTCLNVIEIYKLNELAIINNTEILIYECTTPFGEKTKLLNEINSFTTLRKQTNEEIRIINDKIYEIDNTPTPCTSLLAQFENISTIMTLDEIDENGVQTEFFRSDMFEINSTLYNYLVSTQNDSGFFVCGEPASSETWTSGCTGLVYPEFTFDRVIEDSDELNVNICKDIKDALYEELFNSSTQTSYSEFNNTLSPTVFNSNWKEFKKTLEYPELTGITNNQIKLNILINSDSCLNFCILIDDINMTKICDDEDKTSLFVTKSPGFEITRTIDNKKSWIKANTNTEREFFIANNNNTNIIRQTNYNVDEERLILNSKEIDLTMNMASAVENDVWCYLFDNNNILSGKSGNTICCCICDSSSEIKPKDIYGNEVTLPTAQTYSYNVTDAIDLAEQYFDTCMESSEGSLTCFPELECMKCGTAIKFTTKTTPLSSLWITCSSSGLNAYFITDITNAQGTINNISYSLTGSSISSLNSLIDYINDSLEQFQPQVGLYSAFWDENGECLSSCIEAGDKRVSIDSLITTDFSQVNTLETFENILISELIDVKSRKILSSYPTLKAVYDRYMNAIHYGGPKSNEFNYEKMDKFTGLVKDYWSDLIEQVIPATTLWGSVKVYTNTMFDQQKFKYKSYTSIFGENPFTGLTISSPINGTSGQCETIQIKTTLLNQPVNSTTILRPIFYDNICISQMNIGSEFIGRVSIQNDNDELFVYL